MGAPVIPLATSARQAFELFQRLAWEGVRDVRGEDVEVDLGNYAHVLGKEERIRQIVWLVPTLQEPDLIIRWTETRRGKRPKTAETYIKWICASEEEIEDTLFVVGTERAWGRLRLKTWFVPLRQEEYVDELRRKGEVIWQRE